MSPAWDHRFRPEDLGQVLNFDGEQGQGKDRFEWQEGRRQIWDLQAEGTAWLFNTLAEQRIAYLADEVGMGKTYQALGVMTLLQHLQPDARIVVISPRENVQSKWVGEHNSFIKSNWVSFDDRVKDSALGRPLHAPLFAGNLREFAADVVSHPRAVHYLRLPSFARPAIPGKNDASLGGAVGRITKELRSKGLEVTLRLHSMQARWKLDHPEANEVLSQWFCAVLHQALPEIDLLIVDEAQNLRNRGNQRNTNVARVFGLQAEDGCENHVKDWDWSQLQPKAKRLLLLSATPAHSSASDITTQLSYLPGGVGTEDERQATRKSGVPPDSLLHRIVLRRLRRFEGQTKYDYRGEEAAACRAEDPWQRLTLGLVQAYLERIVDRSGNRFKIGLLSAFESLAPAERAAREKTRGRTQDDQDDEENFTGTHDDDAGDGEAEDENYVVHLQRSLGCLLGQDQPASFPHPKQDLLVERVAGEMLTSTPEKSLIFVRRLASVKELVAKLTTRYDEQVNAWLETLLGDDRGWEALRERLSQPPTARMAGASPTDDADDPDAEDEDGTGTEIAAEEQAQADADDAVRGTILEAFGDTRDREGPARLRRLLTGNGSLSDLFTENPARLLLEPYIEGAYEDFVDAALGGDDGQALQRQLRLSASVHGVYSKDGKRLNPALAAVVIPLVFAARMAKHDEALARQVHAIARAWGVDVREPILEDLTDDEPTRPEDSTLRRLLLRHSVWDWLRTGAEGNTSLTFLRPIQQREDEREELAAWERRELHKAWISKCIRVSEGILLVAWAWAWEAEPHPRRTGRTSEDTGERLAKAWLEDHPLAERLRYRIQRLIDDNVAAPLLKTLLGRGGSVGSLLEEEWRVFDGQQPAVGVVGGSTARDRTVAQFRTPFFPDVIVATSTLQEGVDLHLFCDRVWHYGLAHTYGDMEQRVGRVDRYYSQAHRRLKHGGKDFVEGQPALQVIYPYLEASLDELQLERVLFAKQNIEPLMDAGFNAPKQEREVEVGATRPGLEGLQALFTYGSDAEASTAESPFAAKDDDYPDESTVALEHCDSRAALFAERLGALLSKIGDHLQLDPACGQLNWDAADLERLRWPILHLFILKDENGCPDQVALPGQVLPKRGLRRQPVQLRVAVEARTGQHLLQAVSPVGPMPKGDPGRTVFDTWARVGHDLPGAWPCWTASRRRAGAPLTVESAMLLGLATEQGGSEAHASLDELVDLVKRTAVGADRMEWALFGRDRASIEQEDG